MTRHVGPRFSAQPYDRGVYGVYDHAISKWAPGMFESGRGAWKKAVAAAERANEERPS